VNKVGHNGGEKAFEALFVFTYLYYYRGCFVA